MTPQKNIAAIRHRLAIVREDLETMRRRSEYIGMQGGPNPVFGTLGFHQRRAELLEWMLEASSEDINRRRLEVEAAIGPAVAVKYDNVKDLPPELAEQIAMLMLLEYGLGLHPHQRGAV